LERTWKSVFIISFSDFSLGRALYLAKALSLLRLNVNMITNKPIYAPSESETISEPELKIIKIRLPFATILYDSILGRLIVYSIFALISLLYLLKSKVNPGILYSRGPHPFTDVSCLIYKLLKHDVKVVSDITDLWPDVLKYLNINAIFKYVIMTVGYIINNVLYTKVDIIITLNEEMAKVLKSRIGKDVCIIYGSIDLNKFRPMSRKEALKKLPNNFSKLIKGKFVILYAGIMGPFQDPLVIVDIAEKVKIYPDIIFLIFGSGPFKQKLQETARVKSLDNIFIFDPVPHNLMPFIYNLADLVLLLPPMLSTPGVYEYFILALPKKFIEYSACGKPILCLTPPCVASKLCLDWKAGYHIPPEDFPNVENIIRIIKENKKLKMYLGKNSRKMAEELFSIQQATKVLRKIIHENH